MKVALAAFDLRQQGGQITLRLRFLSDWLCGQRFVPPADSGAWAVTFFPSAVGTPRIAPGQISIPGDCGQSVLLFDTTPGHEDAINQILAAFRYVALTLDGQLKPVGDTTHLLIADIDLDLGALPPVQRLPANTGADR